MEDCNLSTLILQNVLQMGRLDYESTMKGLVDITGATKAHFFETDSANNFTCRYSTTDHIVVGQRYSLDELPPEMFPIMHKSNVIAFVCLDEQDALDNMGDDDKQRIFDSISAGLVMGRLRDDNYTFAMSICHVLSRITRQVLELVSTLPRNTASIQLIDSRLTDVITIIYDAVDFLEIDAGKAVMEANAVPVADFLKETIFILQQDGTGIVYDIEDSVPGTVLMDRQRVQQMLMSVARKLADMKNLRLNVKLEDFSTAETPESDLFLYFHFFSDTSRQNQEIQRRFRVDQVSVATLSIHVVRRLCDMMMGTFSTTDHGLILRIKISVPPKEAELFRGRSVTVAMSDPRGAQHVSDLFGALGSQVSLMKDKTALIQPASFENQALVVVDAGFAEIARFAKRRGIPVVAIGRGLDDTIVDEQFATLPTSWSELAQRCERLIDRNKSSRWL